ncbi:MAG: hypothetical protein RLZZ136_583 [Pseudomonadota bacterium]|jgi:8-oxo-dGTP pyrophosphatase MutT (NUDIX family)
MSQAERRIRRAARIVLVNETGHLLLFRFNPRGSTPFWLPPGGECDPDEDFPTAARRELLEETGITADPSPLGVVLDYAFTTLDGEDVIACEHYFHHCTSITTIDTSGHTEQEKDYMQEHRWFAPSDLSAWHEAIYPENLSTIAAKAQENQP